MVVARCRAIVTCVLSSNVGKKERHSIQSADRGQSGASVRVGSGGCRGVTHSTGGATRLPVCHLLLFRLVCQMESMDAWNVELVVVNSHDAGCAYMLHAGIYRRICSNGLVVSDEGFSALRFRHAGLDPDAVVQASFRLIDFMPRVGELVSRFRSRELAGCEAYDFARHALLLRYGSLEEAPVEPQTLLKARRPEDEAFDLWSTMNRVGENLEKGGVSDWHLDRRGAVRSVRPLKGIDSRISLSKGLWGLAERFAIGGPLTSPENVTVVA